MVTLNMLRRLALSMALVFTVLPAWGHEIRPTIADIEVGETEMTMSLRTTLEALIAGIDLSSVGDTDDAPEAVEYNRLRALSPAELEEAFRAAWSEIRGGFIIESGGERLTPEIITVEIAEVGDIELPREATLTVGATLPEGDEGVQVGLTETFGTFVPRQIGGGDDAYEGFLDGGDLTPELPRAEILTEGSLEVFARYVIAGFYHIIPLGIDHILFVLGLFFFTTQWRPLLLQVSAFTASHTISLALAATGVVSISSSIVEPLIAASIVYVAVENIFGIGNTRRRTMFVFGFGLLHGLGFASVLGDFGIASGRFVEALIGFNIGVEIGQLAVITLAFAFVGWFMKKAWYRKVIVIPASLFIAAISAFWVIERTLL